MVERMNRSLLQLLCVYVETQEEWERYLPLVLYAYRSSPCVNASVPIRSYVRTSPQINDVSAPTAFDSDSYQS